MPSSRAPMRVAAVLLGVLAFSLLSCGREPTGPVSVPVNVFKRVASLAVSPQYETALRSSALRAALSQVAFEKVRITLRREDGTIALDTVVDFPAGADSLTLSLIVPLPAGAPSSGVPMSLNLGYVNAAGDTVFRGGPIPVTVIPPTAGSAPPPPVQIPVHYTGTGSNATSVTISPRSASGLAGQTASFSAVARASDGTVIAGTPVVFSSSDPGVVRIGNPGSGAADFVGRGTAKVYAQLLTGQADSASVTVTLPASRIELASGGSQTAVAGTTLPQPVVARVLAGDGVGVGGVTVNFAVTSGGGSVTSASVVSAADGSASTSWKLGSSAGAQTLQVTSTGLAGSPLTVNATATIITPTKLTVVTQPANGTAGAALAAVAVAAQDANGVTVANFTGDITVALGANPGGSALGGTATVKAVNGVATFSGLSLNKPGVGYTFAFSSAGLTGATSAAFNIVAGNVAKLAFGAMPAAADVGIAIAPPLTVTAQDSAGNTVTTFTGAITVAIGTNPGGGTLTGTLTRNAVAGVATFNDLSINRSGTSYTLVASASGMTGGTSAPFNMAAGAPTGISVVSGSGQTAVAGTALAPISLQLHDALGNGIAGATITLAVATGGGSLSASSLVTDASGIVIVSWTLGGISGTQTFTAASTGVPTMTVSATATGGATDQLVVTTSPGATQTAGVTLTPATSVSYKNAAGVLQTSFTGAVTASVLSGPSGATLLGTTTVNAVNGVASFSALRLNKAGTYTLQFSTSGASNGTTTSFTVLAAPATTIVADSGQAQTGAAAATLAQKLVVLVTDSLGNPVSGRSISWAVVTGGGSVDTATTVTNATGRTRVRFTLGVAAGANSVTATSSGLIGSPVTFTATATGTIASTTLTPHLDTLTSINATFALAAQAKDGAGSNLTGAFIWLSRNPAFVTVDVNGVVKAVANGSTYVVATETGGTRDSALIVVQQRLATINVTPGVRSIYRSASYQFSAAAVDGLGSPMPGTTTFTWSTVTPSVATVDTTGKVTALALGSTQVRATSGAITGVSNVTVLTPITRIVVGRDSSGVPVTDSTAIPSLGVGRFFRAVAHDTLDAVMTGVTFAWSSTNSSVALMDSITATRARALTNANGTTAIQATADNVIGSAVLKVQQVLAAIELTPNPDSVGIAGTKQMTARGKDANNRYITGGSFSFASSAPGVATVNASSGLLTGVTLGSTNITATSGAITSNAAVISVTSTVPGIISFGRDTLTVGRGSSTSIPILLSRASASNVVVNLAARDTNAYFAVASVTIPAGQTSTNVTLNGRNAGTTLIYATDGGGGGFAGDTSAVAVQANMRLSTTGYYLNSLDQVATQVLLSDPSPAGGTFVTFNYGTAGRAQVSPDPAFIPAGQLASNIVITALATVSNTSTTITPAATGVNGAASTLYSYAPILTLSAGSAARLGAGQYESGWYVYTPQYTVLPLTITFTSTDTTVVVATQTVTIAGGTNYVYFTVSARLPGTAKVIATAPGWSPDTLTMTVTTPRTVLSATTSLNTTSPITTATVYATDSLSSWHYRTSALALTVSSSDTNVIRVIDKTPVIAAGAGYLSGIRFQPGGTGGTAYLKVVAGGHAPDSVLITVVGPKLEFNWSGTNQVGVGQYEPNVYIYAPNSVVSPLVISLTSSNVAKVTVPATVTIPAGSNYAYFRVTGVDTGTVSIIASAAGYRGDTAGYHVNAPRVGVPGNQTYNNFAAPFNYTIYARDSLYNARYRTAPLAVSLVSRNPAVAAIDSSTVTIPTDNYYNSSARITVVGVGSTYIVATAPGHAPDSTLFTVQTPKLNFNFGYTVVGRRQYIGSSSYYVYTPNSRGSTVPVTITQTNAASDSLSTTAPIIPANNNYIYFDIAGRSTGRDTLIATASGYLPDTAVVYVSSVKLTNSGLPSTALTTSPNGSINVYATDSIGNSHYVLDTVVVNVTSSDTTVLKPLQRSIRILRGSYYANVGYQYFGPGSATLTFTDSLGSGYTSTTTNAVTVTGPSLLFNTSSLMYGMRQRSGSNDVYVYTQNNVASSTTVNLVSTDTRVATVPASVTIPAGSNYAYFTVTAVDTVGTIQVQATASGFGPATPINVQVTQPRFVISASSATRTTGGGQTITLYAADANGNSHYTTEAVTVSLASSAGAVATIDSASVTIPAGGYYTQAARWLPISVGTAQLSATDGRAALYKYNTGTLNVSVSTPNLSFSWSTASLGVGQYIDQSPVCCFYVSTPDYQAANLTVTLGHNGTAKTTIPSSVTVPSSSYYSYFRITGTSIGVDTLTATASSPAHNPATAYVDVGLGRIDTFSGWPSASMVAGDSVLVTLYTRAPDTGVRPVVAATTFAVAAAANVELRQAGAVVSSVTVPADANQVQFYLKAKASGTGSATFTNANYTSYTPPTVTVTP